MRIILSLALLVASCAATCQMPVQVVDTAEDSVGQRLIYNLKEEIRESRGLELALDSQSYRIQYFIVTLDQNPSQPGNSTVYSAVMSWKKPDTALPMLLDQSVGYCGTQRVEECAESLVAQISKWAEQIISTVSTLQEEGNVPD